MLHINANTPFINLLTGPNLDLVPQWKLQKLDKILGGLILSDEDVRRLREIFIEELNRGLEGNPNDKSCLVMANTYVTQMPDGSEEGEYLALDLGGTNFRIILLELRRGRQTNEVVKFYHIPDHLRVGTGEDLFDYLADCLHQFLEEHERLNDQLPLGFTFSFPLYQKGINSGILAAWTKSFNCSGTVGKDVVRMLNDAIKKRGDLQCEVTALLNDTTGTLVQGAYLNKSTGIGLILGTGSNACYIEKAERVKSWEGGVPPEGVTEVVIDLESGAFGDNGVLDFIRTEFDVQVDKNSLLVHSYTFEKYIAGKYLGELIRVMMVKLHKEGLLFTGELPSNLLKINSFTSRFVSFIEEDSINQRVENTKAILEELELDFDMEDVAVVKHICYLATDRAAKLTSICMAVLLDRMDRDNLVTIAVDGSLFQFHPRLRSLMEYYIHEYTPTRKFALMMAEDGSGKGAVMVVALAKKCAEREAASKL